LVPETSNRFDYSNTQFLPDFSGPIDDV